MGINQPLSKLYPCSFTTIQPTHQQLQLQQKVHAGHAQRDVQLRHAQRDNASSHGVAFLPGCAPHAARYKLQADGMAACGMWPAQTQLAVMHAPHAPGFPGETCDVKVEGGPKQIDLSMFTKRQQFSSHGCVQIGIDSLPPKNAVEQFLGMFPKQHLLTAPKADSSKQPMLGLMPPGLYNKAERTIHHVPTACLEPRSLVATQCPQDGSENSAPQASNAWDTCMTDGPIFPGFDEHELNGFLDDIMAPCMEGSSMQTLPSHPLLAAYSAGIKREPPNVTDNALLFSAMHQQSQCPSQACCGNGNGSHRR